MQNLTTEQQAHLSRVIAAFGCANWEEFSEKAIQMLLDGGLYEALRAKAGSQ